MSGLRASGPWWSLLAVAVAGMAAGLGLGFVSGHLESRVYFLFLYPTAIGVLLGVFMGFLVYLTRCARPRLMTIVAVMAGLAVLAGTWLGRYETARAEYAHLYRLSHMEGLLSEADADALADGDDSVVSDEEVERNFQAFLADETGDTGVLGFAVLRANSGLRTLGMASFELSAPWVLTAWSLEWLIMAALLAFFTVGVARTPFCAQCRRWHVQERLGRAPVARLEALVAAVRAGDLQALHDLLVVKTSAGEGGGRRTTGPVEVVADHCPRCEVGDVHLKVLKPSGAVACASLTTLRDVERLRVT